MTVRLRIALTIFVTGLATALGVIFVVYLSGSMLTPLAGWVVGRFAARRPNKRIVIIINSNNH